VIVIGGGVSRVEHIYRELPNKLKTYVFGGEASTPILPAMYGDQAVFAARRGFGPIGEARLLTGEGDGKVDNAGYAILEGTMRPGGLG